MRHLRRLLSLAALLSVAAVAVYGANPKIVPGNFKFALFSVPNATTLGVEAINNFDQIVGYIVTPTNVSQGYERSPEGKLTTLVDPDDKVGLTQALGVNDEGVVVGNFFNITNTADLRYSGFFYKKGTYTTYDLPSSPTGTDTTIVGINDAGDFCGLAQYPPVLPSQPSFILDSFVNIRGVVTVFFVPGATATYAYQVNIWGQVAGDYVDVNGVFHGFLRETNGHITTIDVPGASSVLPTSPNPYSNGAKLAGTAILGLNDFGAMSGHFYDSAGNSHGFLRTPDGKFYQIDVPTALETAGGGLNDFDQVVGHYVDSTGTQQGYTATPKPEGFDFDF